VVAMVTGRSSRRGAAAPGPKAARPAAILLIGAAFHEAAAGAVERCDLKGDNGSARLPCACRVV
jgi:hypothetical protein